MNCLDTREWLLQAARPADRAAAPVEIARHLNGCPDCQRLTARLDRLERAYRAQPLPATAGHARDAFLASIAARPTPAEATRPSRRFAPPRWAMAACVLFLVGLAALVLWPAPQARASGDLVDRLIELNLDIAEADTLTERSRLYADRGRVLDDLRTADLSPADRQLAESLAESAAWLARNDDPVEEAERFNAFADKLLDRVSAQADHPDPAAAERVARHYQKVIDRGVAASVAKAAKKPALDFDRKHRLEKIVLRDAERSASLEVLLENSPDATRKQIRKALEVTPKHPKPKHPAKPGHHPHPKD